MFNPFKDNVLNLSGNLLVEISSGGRIAEYEPINGATIYLFNESIDHIAGGFGAVVVVSLVPIHLAEIALFASVMLLLVKGGLGDLASGLVDHMVVVRLEPYPDLHVV